MEIEHVNAESVFKTIDAIRRENFRAPSNIFKSYSELCDLLKKKECFCLQNEKAVFIMIPYHNVYYDILFVAINEEYLRNIIDEFKLNWHRDLPVRVSVIGTEREAEKIAEVFGSAGFSLGKKLARIRQGVVREGDRDKMVGFLSPKKEGSEQINFSFAVAGDEKEILSLLLEEFDPCDYTMPELEDIIESIKKMQIVVAKHKSMIIGLHYFEIKNHIFYGIYDLVQKSYRKNFLLYDIYNFRNSFFLKNGITINRYFGWRDTSNKRLMQLSKIQGEVCDGIFIYNMKYNAL